MEFIRSKKPSLSIDLAPLIDVVFQLLIFFMLSSTFLSPAIKLNLPKAVTQDRPELEKVIITIDKAGKFFVNKITVAQSELQHQIKERIASAEKKSVYIQADSEVSYRYFVEAMDAARRAGASQVNIMHQGAGQ